MENQKDIIKWIKENTDTWNLICGVKGEPELEQLEKIYSCLCGKAKEDESFKILLLTLLTRYGKALFPKETGTTEEIALCRYLEVVKAIEK